MNEQLIRRFLNKQCTPEEAERVAAYLKNNRDVLDRFLDNSEWENVEEIDLPQETWDEVWTAIENKRKRSGAAIIWIKRVAVAASVIIIATVGFNYFAADNRKNPAVAEVRNDIVSPEHKVVMNNTKKMMNVYLPDSSLALLSPDALLTYTVPFIADRRDIYLEGKARFNVKKDKTMPFTVFAGGLATTAIGTEFTIDTKIKSGKTINVKLHSGKVLIKPIGQLSKWKNDIYLDPGQQLNFDVKSMIASVDKISNEKLAVKKQVVKENLVIDSTSNEIVFVNTPLTEVISKLENHYKQKIIYDDTEISNMNFTGSISKSDSLVIVLKVIAQMNDLEMLQENERFHLKKLQ